MTRPFHTPAAPAIAAAIATLLTLAACQQKTPEEVGGPADDATAIAARNKAPVTLPPAIASSKTYRCKDNSVVYVNFLTDGLTANVRDKEEEPPAVTLVAPAPGEPFVGVLPAGDGFKLSANAPSVTYTSPDSGTQTCNAKA